MLHLSVTIVIIALIFSMLIPSYALKENGVIEMPFTENPPAIDGMWTTADEWNDASVTSVGTDPSKVFYIIAKHDRDDIYLMLDFINVQSRETIAGVSENPQGFFSFFPPSIVVSHAMFICFDTNNDGGIVLQQDDYCFVGISEYKTHALKSVVIRGDGIGGISVVPTPSGYKVAESLSSKNDPYESGRGHLIFEVAVPISFLHRSDSYGFGISSMLRTYVEDGRSIACITWPAENLIEKGCYEEVKGTLVPSTWGSVSAPAKTITIPPVPVMSVTPRSLSFSATRVSEVSQEKTVIISNSGSGGLRINSIRVTGEFSIDDISTPLIIPPTSKKEFTVKFAPISEGEKKGSITITSNDLSNPSLIISADGVGTLEKPPLGSGCLIATAAFGSELTPQVQFLRNFRDNHILSTTAGSSFMNVFNTWYYSFSPYVADYERQQPWLQQTVKASIYPLLGILQISEKGYSSIEGEYGALVAGTIASSLIGALYFSPVALSVKQIRKSRFNYKLTVAVIAIVFGAVIGSLMIGNQFALMTTTSLFVLTLLSVSAILFAKIIIRIKNIFF